MSARKLAARVVAMTPSVQTQERQAVIANIHAGPPKTVDITLGGDLVLACRYLASYTPTVGDTVRILQTGGDILVLGDLA